MKSDAFFDRSMNTSQGCLPSGVRCVQSEGWSKQILRQRRQTWIIESQVGVSSGARPEKVLLVTGKCWNTCVRISALATTELGVAETCSETLIVGSNGGGPKARMVNVTL